MKQSHWASVQSVGAVWEVLVLHIWNMSIVSAHRYVLSIDSNGMFPQTKPDINHTLKLLPTHQNLY